MEGAGQHIDKDRSAAKYQGRDCAGNAIDARRACQVVYRTWGKGGGVGFMWRGSIVKP